MTLLEMHETYLNGNKTAFFKAVKEYGTADFLLDIIEEHKQGVVSTDELYAMKNTIKTRRDDAKQ